MHKILISKIKITNFFIGLIEYLSSKIPSEKMLNKTRRKIIKFLQEYMYKNNSKDFIRSIKNKKKLKAKSLKIL